MWGYGCFRDTEVILYGQLEKWVLFLIAALLGVFPILAAGFSYPNLQTAEDVSPVSTPSVQMAKTFFPQEASLPVASEEPSFPLIYNDMGMQLQNPELPNGCEVTGLAMVLTSAGFPVDKLKLYSYLPRQDFSYNGDTRMAPDPEERYVGDAASASGGLYCFEGPILQASRDWMESQGGGRMISLIGISQEQLEQLVGEGVPVVVWVTQEYAPPVFREDFSRVLPNGENHVPYDNLHCVVLAGIEGDDYRIADPIRGWQTVDRDIFGKVSMPWVVELSQQSLVGRLFLKRQSCGCGFGYLWNRAATTCFLSTNGSSHTLLSKDSSRLSPATKRQFSGTVSTRVASGFSRLTVKEPSQSLR